MFWRLFVKLFFVDTLLNDRNMQNFGFAYIMASALKRLGDIRTYYERLLSHFEYFNSNPFLISAIIGICTNLEEKGKTDIIYKIKLETMAPLSALADSLVFGTMKPFFTILFVSLAMLSVKSSFWLFWLSFFLITNFLKIYTLYFGYKMGLGFIFQLTKLNLQTLIAVLKRFIVFYLGGFALLYLHFYFHLEASLFHDSFYALLLIFLFLNAFVFSRLKNWMSFTLYILIFVIYYYIKF